MNNPVLALALLGVGGLSGLPPVAVPRVRPNVLLIVADDLGVDHLAFHPVGIEAGHPAPTPYLSSVVPGARLFTHAYGSPTCSASRASLLTGRYPFRHGVGSNVDPAEPTLSLSEVTLAEGMLKAGYLTAGFGKWHVSLDPNDPNLQGFRHFDGSMLNLNGGGGTGYYHWLRNVDGKSGIESGYATSVVADSASAWIRSQAGQPQPWFAYVAFHAPHVPLDAPPRYLDPITNATAGDPDLVRYQGMIEALDTELRRLLSVVDLRDTVVVFLGDNGTPGNVAQPPIDPKKAKKTVFQGGIRIPAMAWGAGVPAGTEDGFVHLVDFYRTLLDLAEAPHLGNEIDSDSLCAPWLPASSRWVPWRDDMFTQRFMPNGAPPAGPFSIFRRALRDDRYKLIQRETGSELYDLLLDPWETNDLLSGGLLLPAELQAYVTLEARMAEILGG